MGAFSYKSLPQGDAPDGSECPASFLQGFCCGRCRSAKLLLVTAIILIFSGVFNAFILYERYVSPWELTERLPTKFAHLTYNVTSQYGHSSDYPSTNRTLQDAAWSSDEADWGTFVISLDEDSRSTLDLPLETIPSPWDSSKLVYLLGAAHDLHCAHVVRNSINQYHDGEEQTLPYAHVMHCLDILRQSVMCNADDTPLYWLGFNSTTRKHVGPGQGSTRTCRDWNALANWSRARSACFRPIHYGEPEFPFLDRWKFCPDNSKPWLKGQQR